MTWINTNMTINEIFNRLHEGPYDPNIFKAIFTAGGPGSGKTTVTNSLLEHTGMKSVDIDKFVEMALKKNTAQAISDELYNKAYAHKQSLATGYLNGRLGLIWAVTGRKAVEVIERAEQFKLLGYDVAMLYVYTSEAVAQQRNQERSRRLDPETVTQFHKQVNANVPIFRAYFGTIEDNKLIAQRRQLVDALKQYQNDRPKFLAIKAELNKLQSKLSEKNFFEVDNSADIKAVKRSPDYIQAQRNILNFLKKPLSPTALAWKNEQIMKIQQSDVDK